jgi:hypothetical protein
VNAAALPLNGEIAFIDPIL